MNNINVKRIKTSKREIFKYWLEFLRPYHKLRQKEIDALALLLYYRYELSREVNNKDLVHKLLFATDTRNQIRGDLDGMSQKVFNNLLTSLRKKGVIMKGNIINPVLVPNMTEDGFKLIFNFEIDEGK
tara:strand:+ start:15696 stop:16079 length:384 start_codon:yes stop_codon:yes gene_type:complete